MKNPYAVGTFEYFNWFYSYDPSTGEFTWKNRASKSQCKVGDVAGYRAGNGYLVLKVGGKSYRAHRVAWLMVHGEWPPGELDHIDVDGFNNAISNLRPAESSQNKFNKRCRKDNSTGCKGVRFSRSGHRFEVQIMAYGKRVFLGSFDTRELASAAYAEESKKMHREFSRS